MIVLSYGTDAVLYLCGVDDPARIGTPRHYARRRWPDECGGKPHDIGDDVRLRVAEREQ